MKPIASTLVFVGCLLAIAEPVSAQLFRRASRSRSARARRCCCVPTMSMTVNAASGSVDAVAATIPHAAPTPAAVPTSVATASSTAPMTATADSVAPTASSDSGSQGEVTAAFQIPTSEGIASPSDVATTDEIKTGDQKKWKGLFDGKQLGDWVSTRFGGEGEVTVEDGQIKCDFGQYISGVTYQGKDLPKNNYEIELEAMRVDGSDFFCGLTFPVDESHATFVVGGWGGSVTGISSIDDFDASENDTTDYMQFENKKWYKIRVRVTKGVLEAWIDDKKMVSKDVDGSRLSTRIEVDPSKPLGIACFNTQAAYRNIRIRPETNPDSKTKN